MAISPAVAAVLAIAQEKEIFAPQDLDHMDFDLVVEAGLDLDAIYNALSTELASFGRVLRVIRERITNDMVKDGATLRSHPRATIELSRETDYFRDVAVLSQLKTVVSPEDYAAFLYPEKPKTPQIKVDLRKRGRIEKYGARAQEILAAGIKEIPGPWKPKWTLKDTAIEGGS
jgi:hypothetical protein